MEHIISKQNAVHNILTKYILNMYFIIILKAEPYLPSGIFLVE
jgi:hypothetical protein